MNEYSHGAGDALLKKIKDKSFEPVVIGDHGAGTNVGTSVLLGCMRYHENEIIALGKYIEESKGDDTPIVVSLNNNFRAKIKQHELFVAALKVVCKKTS